MKGREGQKHPFRRLLFIGAWLALSACSDSTQSTTDAGDQDVDAADGGVDADAPLELPPLSITRVEPISESVDVSLLATVSVTFNNPLDRSGVNDGVLTLARDAGTEQEQALAGTTTVEGDQGNLLRVTPDEPLPPNTVITATLDGVVDLAGGALGQVVSWSFTTEAQGLRLISSTPPDGGVLEDIDAPVVMQFSAPLAAATVDTDAFALDWAGPPGSSSLPELEVDGDTVRLWPPDRGRWREFGRSATITIYPSLEAQDGIPLQASTTLTFTTEVFDTDYRYRFFIEGRDDYALAIAGGPSLTNNLDSATELVLTEVSNGVYRITSVASAGSGYLSVDVDGYAMVDNASGVAARQQWTFEQYGTLGNLERDPSVFEASPDVYLLHNEAYPSDHQLRAPWDGGYTLVVEDTVGVNGSWWFENIGHR